MTPLTDQASAAGRKAAADIAVQLKADWAGSTDSVLVYMAMLLAGLLGTASGALGEKAAFELWDLVGKTGKQGMQMIHGEMRVKH